MPAAAIERIEEFVILQRMHTAMIARLLPSGELRASGRQAKEK
jgi:hypothetical protein